MGFIDGMNQYAYSNHSPGHLSDYWGFASNDIDWSTAVGEGASTLATGGLFIVGLGVISALSAPVAVASWTRVVVILGCTVL